jgi:hypothetical protein
MASLVAKSKKQLGDTIGVGERTISMWLNEGCPGDTGAREYVVREVLDWAWENKWTVPESSTDGDEDVDSLETRKLRREIEKLEMQIEGMESTNQIHAVRLEEQRRSLVDISVVRSELDSLADVLRKSIQSVERKYGAGACDPVRRAIDRVKAKVRGGVIDLQSQR